MGPSAFPELLLETLENGPCSDREFTSLVSKKRKPSRMV